MTLPFHFERRIRGYYIHICGPKHYMGFNVTKTLCGLPMVPGYRNLTMAWFTVIVGKSKK